MTNIENWDKAINYLCSLWYSAGIRSGQVILLHSDIKSTVRALRREGLPSNPELILESFIISIGTQGTLILPTFDITLKSVVYFDLLNSPSKMGVLSETARKDPRFIRSLHPLLSFVAFGPLAESLSQCNDYTGIGPHSIFARLLAVSGNIAILNLSENNSMSFYHHVEFIFGVDYRWTIPFQANIVLPSRRFLCEHGFYARKRDQGIITSVDRMGELLWSKGLYSGSQVFQSHGLRLIPAQVLFEETYQILSSGQAINYLYKKTI